MKKAADERLTLAKETRACVRDMARIGIEQLSTFPQTIVDRRWTVQPRSVRSFGVEITPPEGELTKVDGTRVTTRNFEYFTRVRHIGFSARQHGLPRRAAMHLPGERFLSVSLHVPLMPYSEDAQSLRDPRAVQDLVGYEDRRLFISTKGRAYDPSLIDGRCYENYPRMLIAAAAVATAVRAVHNVDIGRERARELFADWDEYCDLSRIPLDQPELPFMKEATESWHQIVPHDAVQ